MPTSLVGISSFQAKYKPNVITVLVECIFIGHLSLNSASGIFSFTA